MKETMKKWLALSMACLVTLVTLGASATPDKDYLCFTAGKANSAIQLTKIGSPTTVTLQTSTDGTNWSNYTFDTLIELTNVGDKLYFRNAASNVTEFSKSETAYYLFNMDGSIAASGNVMSLVDKSCTATTIPCNYCFYKLFRGCECLTTAPELPATTLAQDCYGHMFYHCGALTTAPELPATTLVKFCYTNIFDNCTSLNEISVAFTAGWGTYTDMWVRSVASAGTFSCPSGLTSSYGSGKIPLSTSSKWTVKNTYDLTISSETGWASMCVNLPLQVPEGVEVYYASAAEGSTITLTQIAVGTKMAPRTAVIVKGAKGTVSFPIVSAAGTSFSGNLFQGSSVDKPCNAGENYVLNASKSSDESVHFSIYTGTTLTNHKAWLPMSAVGGASSIQFRFGDATAITPAETEAAEDVIYNLAGQRVGSDYRGLVIKNGKKVWNK